jgi:hypothetical protein
MTQPPRPQRNWIVPVAVLGFVVVVAIVGVALLEWELLGLRQSPDAGPAQPHYTQSPAPTAFSTTCTSGCLTVASARALTLDASLQRSLDIDSEGVAEPKPPTTAALEYQRDAAAWSRQPGAAPDCFVVGSRSPVALTPAGAGAQSLDPVSILVTSGILGGNTTMTQTARFFTTPEAATEYEQQVQSQVGLCHSSNPRVAPADGLDVPPSVATVAFADSEDRTTTYVYDFLRANAVVRFRVVTSDGVNDNTVRSVLTTWADGDLATMELN